MQNFGLNRQPKHVLLENSLSILPAGTVSSDSMNGAPSSSSWNETRASQKGVKLVETLPHENGERHFNSSFKAAAGSIARNVPTRSLAAPSLAANFPGKSVQKLICQKANVLQP